MTAFFIADLHLGHKAVLDFKLEDGTPLRPFSSLEEMHSEFVKRWNAKVDEKDTVYVLGDVAWKNKELAILGEMKGRKILVRGNHDVEKLSSYAKYFADVRGCDVKTGYIATHIPIHPDCLPRFKLNIHGHLHSNRIKNVLKNERYFCVSAEQVNYTPISIEEIRENLVKLQDQ